MYTMKRINLLNVNIAVLLLVELVQENVKDVEETFAKSVLMLVMKNMEIDWFVSTASTPVK